MIFLSYATEDRARTRRLVEALEAQGWSVWWDRTIPPGQTFDTVIERALANSRCVVVLWSDASVSSDWVKTEAAEAVRRRILVPVLIDDVPIPLEFRRIQAARLVGWNGEPADEEFTHLLHAIAETISETPLGDSSGPAQAHEPPRPPIERPRRSADVGVPPAAHGERRTAGGERRQLTVLSCDLTGSTGIAGDLDPEDWREVATQYQRVAADAVTRFGGHVVKYLDDGLLVYFGWPAAQGDDAERAARAGLAVVEAIARLNHELHGMRLAVRVGMHTGEVVIGEDAGIFGDVPKIAARVQGEAAVDTVLITAATHRLVAGLFVVEDAGARALKGVADPVTLFRLVAPSGVRGRLDAPESSLTPFVDREEARAILRARWELTREGEGQVVLITGEAGIGKSRLLRTFKERIRDTPHTWLECACSPLFRSTPFYPVVEMLERGFGPRDGGDAGERTGRVRRALELAGLDPEATLPLVAPLLDLAVPAEAADSEPEQQRKRLLGALAAWVLGGARRQPAVLAIEDLHWADPSTLELLALVVEQGVSAPLLLLGTARPEYPVPWPARTHHTHVTLTRLTLRHARDVLRHLTRPAALPEEVAQVVLARTDGVPLFLEELTRAVVETDESGGTAVQTIPATLKDSLMARLDRLGAAKEVAQIAAVIGREFSYPLLHAIAPQADPELQAALARLAAAELVQARGLPPDATYAFRHALVQEMAYETLLKSRRRELHGVIARVLGEQFPGVTSGQPELLARHLTAAGDGVRATAAWEAAGDQAFARGAFAEASRCYTTSLEHLTALPAGSERTQKELFLSVRLIQALLASKGYGSPELSGVLARTRQLAAEAGNPGSVLFALVVLWTWTFVRGEMSAAQELADQALAVAGRDGGPYALTWGHLAQGVTRFHRGEPVAAREHLERAVAAYDEDMHRHLVQDPGIMAHAYAALTAATLLLVGDAHREGREALDLAEHLEKPFGRATALYLAAALHTMLREPERALDRAEQCLQISTEHRFPHWVPGATVFRGWALAQLGRAGDTLAQACGELAQRTESTHAHFAEGFDCGHLAEACISAGALAAAAALVERGLLAAIGAERSYLLCLRAEVLARGGAAETEVEATYQEGIAVARCQGALLWELRAVLSYGSWLAQLGRAAAARETLAPVYARITDAEALEIADARAARALLARLG